MADCIVGQGDCHNHNHYHDISTNIRSNSLTTFSRHKGVAIISVHLPFDFSIITFLVAPICTPFILRHISAYITSQRTHISLSHHAHSLLFPPPTINSRFTPSHASARACPPCPSGQHAASDTAGSQACRTESAPSAATGSRRAARPLPDSTAPSLSCQEQSTRAVRPGPNTDVTRRLAHGGCSGG